MKTKTTYEASIEIPVPPNMLVFLKGIPDSDGNVTSTILIFSAASGESMTEAKSIINEFVNDVMEAERNPNGVEVEL